MMPDLDELIRALGSALLIFLGATLLALGLALLWAFGPVP